MEALKGYTAEQINVAKMPWTNKGGDTSGRPEPKDKSRFNFKINDSEQALKCFKDF